MNLAYKKILGKFTKVLGFGKTPPHVGKNSQIISFFFLTAYLRDVSFNNITISYRLDRLEVISMQKFDKI